MQSHPVKDKTLPVKNRPELFWKSVRGYEEFSTTIDNFYSGFAFFDAISCSFAQKDQSSLPDLCAASMAFAERST